MPLTLGPKNNSYYLEECGIRHTALKPVWSIRGRYGAVGLGGTSEGCLSWHQPRIGKLYVPRSLAESYVNRANPSTFQAAVPSGLYAPTWDPIEGWGFTAGEGQALDIGIVPDVVNQNYSMVIGFDGVPIEAGSTLMFYCLAGTSLATSNTSFFITKVVGGTIPMNKFWYQNGQQGMGNDLGDEGAAGMVAMNNIGYYNGEANSAQMGVGSGNPVTPLCVGAFNYNGVIKDFLTGKIRFIGVYNVALTESDVVALYADCQGLGLTE